MAWTPEQVELLKKRWSEGFSGKMIAEEIGGVTRNAVIGKAHRLGLVGWPTRCAILDKALMDRVSPKKNGGTVVPIRAYRRKRRTHRPVQDSDAPPERVVCYGKTNFISASVRRKMGYQQTDYDLGGKMSPFPAPSAEVPDETLRYLIRSLY